MRTPFIALAIISIACTDASAQTYRWVDKEGGVHYTQTPPPPDAKKVQKKNLRGGEGETSNLPYATQIATKNFPVTLYTAPECGAACDEARAALVRRGVPFKEVSVVAQKEYDELQRLSGKYQVPLLTVGGQMQAGFRDDLYAGLLDTAGYPPSGPQLPLEALRKMTAPEPTETQTQGARPAASQEAGAAK
jgi:glutaredoxin